MIKYLKLILAVIALTFCGKLFSQNNLPSDEVEVIKNFEARLAISNKLYLSPVITNREDESAKTFDYFIYPKSLKINYNPPSIRPLAVRSKKPDPGFNAYIEGGYGIPRSPYFLGAYEYNQDAFNLGVHAHHYSANDPNSNQQEISLTDAEVNTSIQLEDKLILFGGIEGSRDHRYYQIEPEDQTPLGDTTERRELNQFKIHAGLQNAEETKLGINYKAVLAFENVHDQYDTRQNAFSTDFELNKYINDKNPIGINFGTLLSNYRTLDLAEQELNAFYANPYYKFALDQFGLRLGVNVWSQNNKARVFPDVDVLVNLKENELILFAETDAIYAPFDLLNNRRELPFLTDDFEVNFEEIFEITAGVKGIYRGIQYNIKGGWRQINNFAQVFNDINQWNRFQVAYDTASNTFLELQAEYAVQKDLVLHLNAQQHFYDLSQSEEVLHRPTTRVELGGKYWTLERKMLLGMSIFAENGVNYISRSGSVEKLDGLFDISVDAKYFFTEHLGVFTQINNIANNKRQRYYLYPSFGVNGIVGVSLRF